MKGIIQCEISDLEMWLQDERGYIYHITEGTGDNLLFEDVEDGYVDYIYYSYYKNMNDVNNDDEYDGGMILLKKYYQDMTPQEIIQTVEEFENTSFIITKED